MLSRASYLLLVLLSGPFALHVLANRGSQSKTLRRDIVGGGEPSACRLGSTIFARPAAKSFGYPLVAAQFSAAHRRSEWWRQRDPDSCAHHVQPFRLFLRRRPTGGIYYEALSEFQRFVNQRFETGALKINVTYIPVRPEQLEQALLRGGRCHCLGVIGARERKRYCSRFLSILM